MSDFNFTFPEMPTYQAFWQAIYFEPIVGSGERITVAVSANSFVGEYKVVRATRPELFECLYGIHAPRIVSMVNLVVESVENELLRKKNLKEWSSPIDGIILGEPTLAYDNDIVGVIKQGLRFSASLSQLSIDAERDDNDQVQPRRYDAQFSRKVKALIEDSYPSLSVGFNKKIKISGSDALTEYGFMNDKYVTNFGLLVPSRLSSSLNTIKAKIFDIEALKKSNYLMRPKRFEIVIGTPSFEDPTLSDAAVCRLRNTLELVEEIADKDEIHIYRATGAPDAADHLVKHAA